MTETSTEAPKRVKRTPAELKATRVEKAQKRLDKVLASGQKVVERAEALRAKAADAQAKADGFAETKAQAQANLAWEKARPIKGEPILTGTNDEPFGADADADEVSPFADFDENALDADANTADDDI